MEFFFSLKLCFLSFFLSFFFSKVLLLKSHRIFLYSNCSLGGVYPEFSIFLVIEFGCEVFKPIFIKEIYLPPLLKTHASHTKEGEYLTFWSMG